MTPTIASLLRQHQATGKSTGGFLSLCACGEAVDEYALHQQDVILQQLFPHLSALHAHLITEPDSVFPNHELVRAQLSEADSLIDTVMRWADANPKDPHYEFNQGYNQAVSEVNHILETGTAPYE